MFYNKTKTFTNTYTAFTKYVKHFKLIPRLKKDGRECFSYVNDCLKAVYFGNRKIREIKEGNCTIESYLQEEMVYTFVVTDAVAILTEFCSLVKFDAEDTFCCIGRQDDIEFDDVYYHGISLNDRVYTLVTTYNTFFAYADSINAEAKKDLNYSMFTAIDDCFRLNLSGQDIMHSGNCGGFRYICVSDVIIVYDYEHFLSAEKVSPLKRVKDKEDVGLEQEAECALRDLESYGAFNDEGIEPYDIVELAMLKKFER